MNNLKPWTKQYQIAVIQKQTTLFNVEAENKSHALEIISNQGENSVEPLTVEFELIDIKCIGEANG